MGQETKAEQTPQAPWNFQIPTFCRSEICGRISDARLRFKPSSAEWRLLLHTVLPHIAFHGVRLLLMDVWFSVLPFVWHD